MQLNGNQIVNFPYGNDIKKELKSKFDVIDEIHEFIVEIDDFPIEVAIDLCFSGRSLHAEYLFCITEEGEKFTLFDCYVMPMQYPTKQIKVIWNKWLLGYHVTNLNKNNIHRGDYLINLKKKDWNSNILDQNNCYVVLDGTVTITIGDRTYGSKNDLIEIAIETKEPSNISAYEKVLLRLLEIYFLQMGFFPKVEKRKYKTARGEEFFFQEDFAAYGKTTKANIRLEYALDLQKDVNLVSVYDNWWKLREIEVVTFNLYAYTTSEKNPVREVPIATCIQCLEGYFRRHHSEEMYKFSKSGKESICKEILEIIKKSSKINDICGEEEINIDDLSKSVNGLLGHINERSLKEILKYSIQRDIMANSIFQYEQKTKGIDNVLLFDKFINKATGHRNWLSPLMETKKRFNGDEIELANKKLKLLFRITLMIDIGLQVTKDSLDRTVNGIDQWYKGHELK